MATTQTCELQRLPEPNPTLKWKVKVTSVVNANKIFVRFVESEEQFQKMVQDMKQFYRSHPRLVRNVTVGGHYVAVSETKAARIRVLSVNNGQVDSYFVDCGFSRLLKLSALHEMHQRFTELPEQAYELNLWSVENNDDALKYVSEIIHARVDQIFVARVFQKPRTVNLYFDVNSDVDLCDSKCINVSVNRFIARKSIELLLSRQHSCIDVYVTHCVAKDGDCFVSVQVDDQYRRKLNSNQKQINNFCERFANTVDSQKVSYDNVYYVKSCGSWRRVKILNTCENRFDVFFVDFGYSDLVNASELKQIDELMDLNRLLPFLSVTVCLPPKNEPWSTKEASDTMQFFGNSAALMRIEDTTNGHRLYATANLFKPFESNINGVPGAVSTSSSVTNSNNAGSKRISSSNFNCSAYKIFTDK